jgi:hypothetical protein
VKEEDYYAMQEGDVAVLMSRTLSEFDNMHNPFIVFTAEGIPGINTNENNIVRQTILYYYSGTEESNINVYDYDYNELGYPIRSNTLEYVYGEGE